MNYTKNILKKIKNKILVKTEKQISNKEKVEVCEKLYKNSLPLLFWDNPEKNKKTKNLLKHFNYVKCEKKKEEFDMPARRASIIDQYAHQLTDIFIIGIKYKKILFDRFIFSSITSLSFVTFYLFIIKNEKKIKFSKIFDNTNKNNCINILVTFFISLFLLTNVSKPKNNPKSFKIMDDKISAEVEEKIIRKAHGWNDERCLQSPYSVAPTDKFDKLFGFNKNPFFFRLKDFLPKTVDKCSKLKPFSLEMAKKKFEKGEPLTYNEQRSYEDMDNFYTKNCESVIGLCTDPYQFIKDEEPNNICLKANKKKKLPKINTDLSIFRFKKLYNQNQGLFWFTTIPFIAIFLYSSTSVFIYSKKKRTKYTFNKTKKIMIFSHIIGGTLAGVFGFLGYTLKSQLFSYISAMSTIFLHSTSAFYQTVSSYGDKKIMVPSYLFLIAANITKSIDILQYPCDLNKRIEHLYLLTTYLWVRLFSIVFKILKIYPKKASPISYTVAIAFAGFVSMGISLGRFGSMFAAMVFLIFNLIQLILDKINKKGIGKDDNTGYMESSQLGEFIKEKFPNITGNKKKDIDDDITEIFQSIKKDYLKIDNSKNIPISLYIDELKWLGYLTEDIYNHIANDFDITIDNVKEYMDSNYTVNEDNMVVSEKKFKETYEKYIFLSHYTEKFFLNDRSII
jgi:hypothetical protein